MHSPTSLCFALTERKFAQISETPTWLWHSPGDPCFSCGFNQTFLKVQEQRFRAWVWGGEGMRGAALAERGKKHWHSRAGGRAGPAPSLGRPQMSPRRCPVIARFGKCIATIYTLFTCTGISSSPPPAPPPLLLRLCFSVPFSAYTP